MTRIASVGSECVACGCCVTACPKSAIYVDSGIRARVTPGLCVGCGRCAGVCPAAVISIIERKASE